MKQFLYLFLGIFISGFNYLYAGTFDDIYTILQSKGCTTSGCHGSSLPSGLDLSGGAASAYDNLVGVAPNNSAAVNKNYELVKKGHPYRSFLLHKLNQGLIHQYDSELTAAEGDAMPPSGANQLSDIELETIRQWIFAGAPETGDVVDVNLITDYYNGSSVPEIDRPEPPAPGKGFQIHLGPLFIDSFEEQEYVVKYEVGLNGPLEINRTNVIMGNNSHHLIVYLLDNAGAGVTDGLRDVNIFSNPFTADNDIVGTWQYDDDLRLPGGTAFFWDQNTVLDLNYHFFNFSSLGILPAHAYMNVHTQPSGTAVKEMKSRLELNTSIFLPTGQTTLTDNFNNGQQWNIWMLTSHTHQYGTDFDIYENDNGSKGTQIYEGHYSYENGYSLGYYDYAHQTTRYFAPYHVLPQNTGIIHEAKYNNTSGGFVLFGLTTNDEMMISVLQYTEGADIPFVAIPNIEDKYCSSISDATLDIYPTDGVLTGPGVSANVFDPSAAGIGVHTLLLEHPSSGVTINYDVEVIAPVTPIIVQNGTDLEVPPVYQTYQWYLDGNPISGAVGFNYPATVDGNYTVDVYDGMCSSTSAAFSLAAAVSIQVKMLLEGNFEAGALTSTLADEMLVPLVNPYTGSPWMYSGIETLSTLLPNMVDWVLVELMDASFNVVASQAAILYTDGQVRDINGNLNIEFAAISSASQYHVVVRHRNHLDLISQTTLDLSTSPLVDFTDPQNVDDGLNQMVDMGAGVFALRSGDIDGNGVLTVDDFNSYISSSSAINQYDASDCDLDSNVTVADYNKYSPNSSLIGVSAIRYN